eukprot:Tbor_TRINITY_DN5618_c1_g7::TRINITY_DN5618_c1_g7_i1::g.8476::m.8476/K07300/chaA, CAX; Ca2+:H+ antiporter
MLGSRRRSLGQGNDCLGYGSMSNLLVSPDKKLAYKFPTNRDVELNAEHPGTVAYSEEKIVLSESSDFSFIGQLKKTTEPKYIKLFLVFVPIVIILYYFGNHDKHNGRMNTCLFILSFLGIIPLASLLGDFTEDLALHTNDIIGALINVTFGNATELIISIFALRAGYFNLIKMSLLGSVFGNMLLVLGASIIICGVKHQVICFNSDAANTYIPLLTVAVLSFTIPAGYEMSLPNSTDLPTASIPQLQGIPMVKSLYAERSIALTISRAIAGIDCVLYVLYLIFQLYTHKAIFDKKNEYTQYARRVSISHESISAFSTVQDDDDDDEGPNFSVFFGIIGVIIVSIFISILSDILVDTIKPAAKHMGLSSDFIGFILVPIVGNAAEHSSACIMAYKGKMDIVVSIALGSAIQIGLLMMPFLVVMGGILDVPLDMNFHPFAVGILLVSVLVTAHTICDGRTNWLEGAMLLAVYCMTAVLFFVGHVPLNGN